MTHSHKVEKIKSQSDFDDDGSGHIVVKNISGRNITIGLPPVLLNPDVLLAIKSYKLEIIKTEEAKEKPKKTKIEETKVEKVKEETLTTVADSAEQVSVQLDLPDDSKTLNSDEL